MRSLVVLALGAVGCNAILGLSPTTREASDAADAATITDGAVTDAVMIDADPLVPDAVVVDANLAAPDAGPPDACVPFDDGLECTANTCGNPPLGAGVPCSVGYCDGGGACVECVKDLDCGVPNTGSCTMPVCVQHACTIGPAPRDTLCNNQLDQCDGAGNCVDCTNSGGCGECCGCFSQVCLPV